MKKILILGLAIGWAGLSHAQYDKEAREILDAMSLRYQNITAFEADISYNMVNKTEDIDESYNGEIAVMGDKFKLFLADQEVINNGEIVWTYLPDAREVNIDFHDAEAGDITPSTIYNIYKDGYKYMLLNSGTVNGKVYDIIDLVPNNKDSQYFKIKLEISQADKTLRKFTMFDKEGSEYSYLIKNFDQTVNLSSKDFDFDPSTYTDQNGLPIEIDIIDLR